MADQVVFGRKHELDLIRGMLLRALDGTPGACIITGDVGMGKTALLDAAVTQAGELGFAIAESRPGELSRYVPFGALLTALDVPGDGDPGTGASPQPASGSTAGGESNDIASEWRFRVIGGLIDLVEQRALEQPLLLTVDDLPHADTGSVAALELILERVVARPFAVITTLRTPVLERSVEAFLERVERQTGAIGVRLGPLADEAVLELGRRLLNAEVGSSLRQRLSGASGNPLLVSEFIRAAQQEGLIRTAGGMAEVLGGGQPAAARSVIIRRLGFLPDPVLQTVRVAAVAAHPVLPDTLASVRQRAVADVIADCEIAVEAGVLAEAEADKVSFAHDLLREVLYEDLAPSARGALHRAFARALIAVHEDPVVVAHHLGRGARRGDTDAVDWLRTSAEAVSRRDPTIAADLLRHALDIAELPADEEAALRAELAALLVWSNLEDAEVEARAALELATSPTIRARAREVVIRALSQRTPWPQLRVEVDPFADDPATPRQQRLRTLADSVVYRGWSGDVDGAYRQGQEALAEALARGDDAAAVSAEAGIAGVLLARGDLGEALVVARAAVHRSHGSDDDDARRRHVQVPLALILQECDRFDEEAEVIADGRSVGMHLGTWQLPLYHFQEGARLLLSGGSWDDATAEIEAGFALVKQSGTTSALAWAHACLALIAVHRGDVAEAGAQANAAGQALTAGGGGYGAEWVALAGSRLQELAGDRAGALATLRTYWDIGESMQLVFHRRLLGERLVRLSAEVGDTALARSVADAMAELADRNDVQGLRASARLCAGIAASDPGLVLEAVELARVDARLLERAELFEAAAGALRDHDAISAARVLTEGAELYASLGATGSSERCEAVLRELGAGTPRRRATRRPAHGWGSLTPTELRVAALVAEGLTNVEVAGRLHISRHTVETHVKHIYAKLAIRSRVQLARLVHQHGQS